MPRSFRPGPASSGPAREPLHPATLLTAIPALLGFVPERSIVVIAFGVGSSIRATMRHDLALDDDGRPLPGLVAVLDDLGEITAGYGAQEVVVVLADDRHPADDPRYRRILAIADRAFAACGGVRIGFGLSGFDAGAPWSVTWGPDGPMCAVDVPGDDRGAHGVLGDPHTCPTAVAAAVRTGRRILRRRSEMREMLEPLPGECGPGRRLATCPAGVHRGDTGEAGGGRSIAGMPEDAAALGLVLDVVVEATSPDCATLDRVAAAIVRLDVRDALLALAVTDLRDDAERLWRELTRRLTGAGRASAATLLAHLHYIGGEGAYAGVALDCALAADPNWKLAQLLDSALRAGVRPTMLWEMIGESYGVADHLGVTIPTATLRAAG